MADSSKKIVVLESGLHDSARAQAMDQFVDNFDQVEKMIKGENDDDNKPVTMFGVFYRGMPYFHAAAGQASSKKTNPLVFSYPLFIRESNGGGKTVYGLFEGLMQGRVLIIDEQNDTTALEIHPLIARKIKQRYNCDLRNDVYVITATPFDISPIDRIAMDDPSVREFVDKVTPKIPESERYLVVDQPKKSNFYARGLRRALKRQGMDADFIELSRGEMKEEDLYPFKDRQILLVEASPTAEGNIIKNDFRKLGYNILHVVKYNNTNEADIFFSGKNGGSK